MLSLLFLAITIVLFLFSLALLPPVELYCRFRAAAVMLVGVQLLTLGVGVFRKRAAAERPLVLAGYVFIALGIAFNSVLLISARGRC